MTCTTECLQQIVASVPFLLRCQSGRQFRDQDIIHILAADRPMGVKQFQDQILIDALMQKELKLASAQVDWINATVAEISGIRSGLSGGLSGSPDVFVYYPLTPCRPGHGDRLAGLSGRGDDAAGDLLPAGRTRPRAQLISRCASPPGGFTADYRIGTVAAPLTRRDCR